MSQENTSMMTGLTYQEIWFHAPFNDQCFWNIKLLNALFMLDGKKPQNMGDFNESELSNYILVPMQNTAPFTLEEGKQELKDNYVHYSNELKNYYKFYKLDVLNLHLNDDDFSTDFTCAPELIKLVEDVNNKPRDNSLLRHISKCPLNYGFKIFMGDYRDQSKTPLSMYDLIFLYVDEDLNKETITKITKDHPKTPLFLVNFSENPLEKSSIQEDTQAIAEFIFHNHFLVERNSLMYCRDFLYNHEKINKLFSKSEYISTQQQLDKNNKLFLL